MARRLLEAITVYWRFCDRVEVDRKSLGRGERAAGARPAARAVQWDATPDEGSIVSRACGGVSQPRGYILSTTLPCACGGRARIVYNCKVKLVRRLRPNLRGHKKVPAPR